MATVVLPASAIPRKERARRFRFGLTIASARLLPNLQRCYKCHMLGQTAARCTVSCPGRDLYRRCGSNEHVMKECTKERNVRHAASTKERKQGTLPACWPVRWLGWSTSAGKDKVSPNIYMKNYNKYLFRVIYYINDSLYNYYFISNILDELRQQPFVLIILRKLYTTYLPTYSTKNIVAGKFLRRFDENLNFMATDDAAHGDQFSNNWNECVPTN